MKKITLTLVSLLLQLTFVYAYQLDVKNFSEEEYHSHQTNWDIKINDQGVIYFANSYGLMSYDGIEWKKIGLPNSKSPRSLNYNKKGQLFVGAYNEVGVLKNGEMKDSNFISLSSTLNIDPESLGQMNYCEVLDEVTYFGSQKAIAIYNGKTLKVLKPTTKKGKFLFLGKTKGEIIVNEYGRGIGVLKNGEFNWLENIPAETEIKGVEKVAEGEYVLYTLKKVLHYKNKDLKEVETSFIPKDAAITYAYSSSKHRVICTSTYGVYILNKNFGLEFHFTTGNGLLSNYIYKAYLKNDVLYLATNHGVSIIDLLTPLKRIENDFGITGTGFSSLYHKGKLYLGTTQGLYVHRLWGKRYNQKFEKIPGTKLFVYDIHVANDMVLCGDQSDLYEIYDGRAHVISPTPWQSGWAIKSVPNNPNVLLVGKYSGIDVYKWEGGHWKFKNSIAGFEGAAKEFTVVGNNIWIVDGLYGLSRISMNEDFSTVKSIYKVNENENLKPDHFNDIVSFKGQLFASSFKGMYEIKGTKVFMSEKFKNIKFPFHRLRKIDEQFLYTVVEGEPFIFKETKAGFELDSSNILNHYRLQLVGSNELITSIDGENVLIGNSKGFYIYKQNETIPRDEELFVRRVEVLNQDSMKYKDATKKLSNNEMTIPFSSNNLRVHFSGPIYLDKTKFKWETSVVKEGKQPHFYGIKEANFKEIQNLHEGEYVITIRAVSKLKTVAQTSFKLTILPPWYRTTASYVVYGILILLLIVIGFRLLKRRIVKLEAKYALEKKRELQFQEMKFNEERLKHELNEKELERSYLALNYTQKKELFHKVSLKINTLIKEVENPEIRSNLYQIESAMKYSQGDKVQWDNFQIHFNNENDDFITKLKKLDPRIKESTVLMCTYIRMGKSNKEIANLLNITVSAVDKKKSRLKAKIEVPKDMSLNEFLLGL